MGPLGGILTGLRRVGGPLLVLACDLPLLDDAALARLLAGRAARPGGAVMTTFRQSATGRIEPLVAVYEQAAAPLLAAAAAQGLYKLARAIPPARHDLPCAAHEADAFLNINFPADLERLERLQPQAPQPGTGGPTKG
jgi:molybdopterin-guanine dinucleotide biosynthesis protein A